MSDIREEIVLLKSAIDELASHVSRNSCADQIKALIASIKTALDQLRIGKPDLARTTLERALQENKL